MKKEIKTTKHTEISLGGLLVMALWLGLSFLVWFHPAQKQSFSERRALAQAPPFGVVDVLSGQYMRDFEIYAKDQFPQRFLFRRLNAWARTRLFMQGDNHGIYLKEGYAVKMEYPFKPKALEEAMNSFHRLYESYMKKGNHRIFMAVIPDKNYFLSGGDYPSLDYDRFFQQVKEQSPFAHFVDLREYLSIEDYYRSDIHWAQPHLLRAAEALAERMGIWERLSFHYQPIRLDKPFFGIYYGQSALKVQADELVYLDNDNLKDVRVYNLEKDSWGPVYDLGKLNGRDPYDLFLSGPAALLIAENPHASTERELIVFRDSFGSSFIPLLLEAYARVTLIDTRYIAQSLIGDRVDFSDQDVLFFYSTTILNSPGIFK